MDIEAIKNWGRNSVERARGLVTQAPIYAQHLREMLHDPQKRFNFIWGAIGLGGSLLVVEALRRINNPELNKRMLIAFGMSIVAGVAMSFLGPRLSRETHPK